MTGQDGGLTSRRGFPMLPDPDGDERLFRQQVIAAVKELYARVGSFDKRIEAVERKLGLRE